MRPLTKRTGTIRVRCLGLKCKVGTFLTDDPSRHRFCHRCNEDRIRAAHDHVEPARVTREMTEAYQG